MKRMFQTSCIKIVGFYLFFSHLVHGGHHKEFHSFKLCFVLLMANEVQQGSCHHNACALFCCNPGKQMVYACPYWMLIHVHWLFMAVKLLYIWLITLLLINYYAHSLINLSVGQYNSCMWEIFNNAQENASWCILIVRQGSCNESLNIIPMYLWNIYMHKCLMMRYIRLTNS